MKTKSIFKTALLSYLNVAILNFAVASEQHCNDLQQVKQSLLLCEADRGVLAQQTGHAQSELQGLRNALGSSDLDFELRRCEFDKSDLEFELHSKRRDLSRVEDKFSEIKSRTHKLRREVRQKTKGWECVLADRKYMKTSLGKGPTIEVAFEKARYDSPYRDLFRKHGWWSSEETPGKGFCSRVF